MCTRFILGATRDPPNLRATSPSTPYSSTIWHYGSANLGQGIKHIFSFVFVEIAAPRFSFCECPCCAMCSVLFDEAILHEEAENVLTRYLSRASTENERGIF